MQESRIQAAPSLAIFSASVAAGAIGLGALAVVLAAIDAPFAWLEGGKALWLFAVVPVALAVSIGKRVVEWRRGMPLLEPDGAIAAFAWAFVLFHLANMLALLTLGLVLTILLVAGSPLAALLIRALVLMLVGGAWLTFAAILIRDLLLLARRR